MIDRLPALRKTMPWTFWATVIGLASMAGVPPLLGFISKEQIFTSFLDIESTGLAWTALAIAAFGAVLTFAYCGKILTGAFLDGEEPEENITEASWKVVVPAAFPIVIGLPLAFVVSWLEAPVLHAVTSVFPGYAEGVSLYLWHGITAELIITLFVFAIGTALVLRRGTLRPRVERPTFRRDGAQVLAAIREFVMDRGMWLADLTRMDYPARHLAPIMMSLAALIGGGSLALWATGNVLPLQPGLNRPIDVGLLVIAAAGVIALCLTSSRLGGAVLLGGVGIAMTVQLFMLGAADVGLTQLLVEVLTVLVIMLVLRKLPLEFSYGKNPHKKRNATISIAVGALPRSRLR